jgi:AraC-like DNA-binding protein
VLDELTGRIDPAAAGGPDRRDRIRLAPGAAGIERLEAHLHGQAFAPHRHDTYAIGFTFAGVQTFRFRGQRWNCLPGQCHILHPDELHDGGAGDGGGFAYRMVYLDPALVQSALGGRPLPFVAQPVHDLQAGATDIWSLDTELDEVMRTDLVVSVVKLLMNADATPIAAAGPLALDGLTRVRALIAADPSPQHAMAELERIAGLDRWTLARQFRAAFGTSPSRFRTLRRLDRARRSLAGGASLADAAATSGFADQSHMTRQFKRAYGLTPARWTATLA